MVQVSDKIAGESNKKDAFLGIDVGSVSCKFVLIDADGEVLTHVFLRNRGSPIESVKEGMIKLKEQIENSESLQGY